MSLFCLLHQAQSSSSAVGVLHSQAWYARLLPALPCTDRVGWPFILATLVSQGFGHCCLYVLLSMLLLTHLPRRNTTYSLILTSNTTPSLALPHHPCVSSHLPFLLHMALWTMPRHRVLFLRIICACTLFSILDCKLLIFVPPYNLNKNTHSIIYSVSKYSIPKPCCLNND